jgi:hypothetical protein
MMLVLSVMLKIDKKEAKNTEGLSDESLGILLVLFAVYPFFHECLSRILESLYASLPQRHRLHACFYICCELFHCRCCHCRAFLWTCKYVFKTFQHKCSKNHGANIHLMLQNTAIYSSMTPEEKNDLKNNLIDLWKLVDTEGKAQLNNESPPHRDVETGAQLGRAGSAATMDNPLHSADNQAEVEQQAEQQAEPEPVQNAEYENRLEKLVNMLVDDSVVRLKSIKCKVVRRNDDGKMPAKDWITPEDDTIAKAIASSIQITSSVSPTRLADITPQPEPDSGQDLPPESPHSTPESPDVSPGSPEPEPEPECEGLDLDAISEDERHSTGAVEQPQPKLEPEPEPELEPELEPEPKLEPQPELELEPEPKLEPHPEPNLEVEQAEIEIWGSDPSDTALLELEITNFNRDADFDVDAAARARLISEFVRNDSADDDGEEGTSSGFSLNPMFRTTSAKVIPHGLHKHSSGGDAV